MVLQGVGGEEFVDECCGEVGWAAAGAGGSGLGYAVGELGGGGFGETGTDTGAEELGE